MSISEKLAKIAGVIPPRERRTAVTRPYRRGRQYRVQQIVIWENDRPRVKTIVHQMY